MVSKLRFLIPDNLKQILLYPGYYLMVLKRLIFKGNGIEKEINMITAGFDNEFGGYFNIPLSNRNGDVVFHGTNMKAQSWAPKGKVAICIKLSTEKRGKAIAYSNSWNWQQGSMTRWVDDNLIGYNDFDETKQEFCFKIIDMSGEIQDVIPYSLGAVSNNFDLGINYSFERLSLLRPDYGYYCRKTSKIKKSLTQNIAFSIVNIAKKEEVISINFSEIRELLNIDTVKDKVNHFEFNSKRNKVAYLYRYWVDGIKYTVFMIFDIESQKHIVIGSDDFYSHFCWLNNFEILVFGRLKNVNQFFVININNNKSYKPDYYIPQLDSHPTINKDNIVFDSYPSFLRKSKIYYASKNNNKSILLFSALHHPTFRGVNRIDHHPRFSVDGEKVFVDYPYGMKRKFGEININN